MYRGIRMNISIHTTECSLYKPYISLYMVGGVLRGARESFIEFGGVLCGRKKAGKRCTKGSIFV